METNQESAEYKPRNMYVPICVTQLICVAAILISVLIVKFFFNNTYMKLGTWCKENVLEQTQITAFLEEEENSEN